MRLEVIDVVGAVSWIINKGYDGEYRIKDGHLFDLALNCRLDPSTSTPPSVWRGGLMPGMPPMSMPLWIKRRTARDC